MTPETDRKREKGKEGRNKKMKAQKKRFFRVVNTMDKQILGKVKYSIPQNIVNTFTK